jgi:integrase/recombinase XerD
LVDDVIHAFIDALWLEEGLAKNTLEAYRRDLSLYAAWLLETQARGVITSTHQDIEEYLAYGYSLRGKATSANRRLTVFKRFFRWCLRERLIKADPTLKLLAAKQPPRLPKTLTEADVEQLLAAPDVTTPLGLRDRAMLELMYASGLRVSECVSLKVFNVSLADNVLRTFGKGSKERIVPFGEHAADWVTRQQSWQGHDASGFLANHQKACAHSGYHQAVVAPYLAPCLCHASAQPWGRFTCRANAARPCRYFYHDDLHARGT